MEKMFCSFGQQNSHALYVACQINRVKNVRISIDKTTLLPENWSVTF